MLETHDKWINDDQVEIRDASHLQGKGATETAEQIREELNEPKAQVAANHWQKRFPELEKELLDTYYKFKGWNDEGIPTRESLEELGLDYVSEEFIQRGILTVGENAPAEETASAATE